MNLCVNARDAMAEGGTLTIRAENVVLDETSGVHLSGQPGPHVQVWVEDTGTGIPADVLDKVFDPFFTTKEPGKGTGLGLSTALGIVRNHGGQIQIFSKVGEGTRFVVNLPALTSEEAVPADEGVPELPMGHGELILVVDDESAIVLTVKATLESAGFRVLAAHDGREVLALFQIHQADIRAILLDMMMPVMDGPATIEALQRMDPHVRIIATSGLRLVGKDVRQIAAGARSVAKALCRRAIACYAGESPAELAAMPTLLVIDDERLILDCFRFLFSAEEAEVLTATTGAEGLELLARHNPDVVVIDVRLPDLSGLELFRKIHELDAQIPVILITGHGTAETAIEAMRLGAYEYVVKPLDPDPLRSPDQTCVRHQPADARAGNGWPRPSRSKTVRTCSSASCPAMQEVYKAIGRVAPQDVTVLDPGRERHRQGAGGAGDLPAQPAFAEDRFWRSTAPPSPRHCWRASCSATRKARLPAPTASGSASSSNATAGRCSSTRSAT